MKHLSKLVMSAVLALASGSLRADMFSFSYVMSNTSGAPGEFHGTLTGTQVGDYTTGYVTGVSVLSLFVTSVDPDNTATTAQITGTIFTTSDDGTEDHNFNSYGTAVVSYARDQNNFLFINGDFLNGDPFDGYAYLLNGAANFTSWAAFLNDPTVSATDIGDGVWTLTNLTNPPPTSVPDNGATICLLGLALIGFVSLRRSSIAR